MAFDLKLLKKLTEAFGPSGREDEVGKIIFNKLKKDGFKPIKDVHGNVKITMGNSGSKILVTAHMDEVGVVVNYIDQKGFLKITPIGGVYKEGLFGSRILFENNKWGTVFSQKTMPKIETDFKELFVDIGAKDKTSTEKQISIGTFGVFHREMINLGDTIMAKALDDRIGVYVLLKTIEAMKDKKKSNSITFGFTVQEEFSSLGARSLASTVDPKIAIAVDVTDSDDIREKYYLNMILGNGPTIKIMDSSLISHPKLKNFFIETAKSEKLKFQLEVLPHGGTDGGAMSLVKNGIPTIGISVPTRYIHTPSEIVNKKDVEDTIKLLTTTLLKKQIGEIV